MTNRWVRIDVDSQTRIDVVPRFEAWLRESLHDPVWMERVFGARTRQAPGGKPPASEPTPPNTDPTANRSGRARLVELPLDGGDGAETVLVRRGVRGGWLGPVLGDRHATPHRPLRELAANLELRTRGAPVPEPVFAAARRSGLVWRTAFASVRIRGARDLLAHLLDGKGADLARPSPTPALRVASAAGRAIRRFHDCGGSHADLHLGNLLARIEGETPEIWLVDLDRARVRTTLPPSRRARELVRLRRSLRKHARDDVRLIAACFAGYCDGDRELRRALRRGGSFR